VEKRDPPYKNKAVLGKEVVVKTCAEYADAGTDEKTQEYNLLLTAVTAETRLQTTQLCHVLPRNQDVVVGIPTEHKSAKGIIFTNSMVSMLC
jgi:hypothetical protein